MAKREHILGTNRPFSVIITSVKRNTLPHDLKELKKNEIPFLIITKMAHSRFKEMKF